MRGGTGTFEARDGIVFHRGVNLGDTAPRLLESLRQDARAGDWWSPKASALADELAAAMAEAYRMEKAA